MRFNRSTGPGPTGLFIPLSLDDLDLKKKTDMTANPARRFFALGGIRLSGQDGVSQLKLLYELSSEAI